MATRVTQAAVEVLVQSTATQARVTQAAVEVLEGSSTAKSRVTQVAVEVLVAPYLQVDGDLTFDAVIKASVGRSLIIDARIGDAPVDSSTGDSVGVPHSEVYGSPVYDDALIHSEVYGERPLLAEGVPVNKDLTFSPAISGAVHSDLVLAQVVLNLATKNLAIDYVIDEVTTTQVNSDLGFEYIIGTAGGAHKDLAFHYRVTKATKIQQRGASLQVKYQIQQRLQRGKDLSFKYRVIEPTHVGASRQFTYRINRNTVAGASLGVAYAIQKNSTVGANLGLNYTVLPVPTQAGLNLHFTYEVAHTPPVVVAGADFDFDFGVSINNLAGASLFFADEISINVLAGADLPFDDSISINNLVGSELALDFEEQVKTSVGEDLDLDWDVQFKAEVGTDLDIDAEVELSTPRNSLDFSYEIEQSTPSVELGIDWTLRSLAGVELDIDRAIGVSQVGSELEFDAVVEQAAEDESDHHDGPTRYVIVDKRVKVEPAQVSSDLVIDWEIQTQIESDLGFAAAIATLVTRDLQQDYTVRNRTARTIGIDYRIVDWYDTNQSALLSEIDEDLSLIA